MGDKFLRLLTTTKCVNELAAAWRQGHSLNISGLAGPVKPGLLCALKQVLNVSGAFVFLVPQRDSIREYRRVLNYFFPTLTALELYPANLSDTQVDTKNKELLAERLAALQLLEQHKNGVVFVTAEAFLQKLPEPLDVQGTSLTFKLGQQVEQQALAEELVNRGYERVEQVETLGQFAIRGDIMDIFPINLDNPLRLEWFDDALDGLRSFDLATQRSLENLQETEISAISWTISDKKVSIFEYLHESCLPIVDEPGAFFNTLANLYTENKEHSAKLFTVAELEEVCATHQVVTVSALAHQYFPAAQQVAVPVRSIAPYNKNTALLVQDLKGYLADNVTPLIMMSTAEKAAGLTESFKGQGLPATYTKKLPQELAGQVWSWAGELSAGFRFWEENWVLLTESDIFGMQKRRRLARHKQAGARIQYFSEIKAGDYVVHDVHGIGRYEGVQTMEIDGMHRDYLHIAYAKEDKLFVPVEQVNLLHKYIGTEGKAPRLSRMGGADWKRTTNKAKIAITELATELLRLYAQRKITSGHAFAADTPFQQEFEASFPFEETPDQLKAIAEIKADMEKPVPMDRLLCGDVGYGKTEVAARAAFKAVMDGKQVAVLAPTTVLAQQHLLTFTQRMHAFGVTVDLLSRFRTPKEQKAVLRKAEEGQIDILIGTHRLLQADVRFKSLGLLIIDEEQRFGVAQKEKIKKWSIGIDVLALSATPIPRTLHMALVNGKDMSVIESPPEDRLPVETYVAEYNEEMIREALIREIRRGGRIYYVHNRVNGLEKIASLLRAMVPGLTIRIAHGQMTEDRLEDAMVDFYEGKIDVLLCTTIIENGLDVPLANTIIIDGAENFGLSQLYQMRGRVGRSSRLAYAYFIYRKNKVLSEIAQKRLEAIRDFTELGAGFKIAMRDLEIRGAGNLLGPQQHGHIAGIGFAAYCALLESTILSLKNGQTTAKIEPDPVIEIKLDAYIPEEYISDPRYKLELYRRCSELDYRDRDDLMDEIIDRFGTPPEEVVNLWRVAVLRSLCRLVKIAGITARTSEIRITFSQHTLCQPQTIVGLVQENEPALRYREGSQPQLIMATKFLEGEPLEWLEQTVLTLAQGGVLHD